MMSAFKLKEPGMPRLLDISFYFVYYCEYMPLSSFNLTKLDIHMFPCAEPQFYRLEGVWLTEAGMSLLRSISMSPLHKRRQRRSRLGTLCIDGVPDGLELKEGDGDGEEGKGIYLIPF